MTRSVMKVGLAVALAAGVGVAAWGAAAQDKVAVVKDRQQTMKTLGASMKTIKEYLDGKAGDQAKATESAEKIHEIAQVIPTKFPKGTGMDAVPDSGAKPVVWTDWDKFLSHQKELVAESEKLVAAAKSGDKSKLQAQFAATGKQGCGGCHDTFRQKKT